MVGHILRPAQGNCIPPNAVSPDLVARMSKSHEANVENQFGPRADAYIKGAILAAGDDLDVLEDIARREAPANAMDVGCGGGHVAYRLARHSDRVVAIDLSSEMLAAVAASARERGLSNIETSAASAECLPYEDHAFQFLASRFSAHHWRGFEAGLREARRVLEPRSIAVFIDPVAPGRAPFDTHLQAIELLRDTSHVRDYTVAEWLAALDRAGFAARALRTWRLRMDFPTWTARIRTPDLNQAAIRALQLAASVEVVDYFGIESDGSFLLDTMMIEAIAV